MKKGYPGLRARFSRTKPDCRCGRSLWSSTAMRSRSRPVKARLTRRRFRRSVPARNATFESSKARKAPTEQDICHEINGCAPSILREMSAAAIPSPVKEVAMSNPDAVFANHRDQKRRTYAVVANREVSWEVEI